MDFKFKYYKYKTKYLNLRNKLNLFHEVDTKLIEDTMSDIDEEDLMSEVSNIVNTPIDNTDYKGTDELVSSKGPSFPFYIKDDEEDTVEVKDTESETTTDESEMIRQDALGDRSDVYDVGMFGLAQGKEKDIMNIDESDYITINDKPNKKKILRIYNVDDFDEFTDRFGNMYDHNNKQFLYIKWNKVADHYKGILIDDGLNNERYTQAFYKGEMYNSWWSNEYKVDNKKAIIFEEPLYVIYKGIGISKPFKGFIKNENDFTDNDYAKFNEPSINKILHIDNVPDFDRFTNKYGSVNNKDMITINWKEVSDNWKGFYFDKDSFVDLFLNRYRKAMIDGKKYYSWWVNEGIRIGVVYIFNKN
jgi:hypothetical protein